MSSLKRSILHSPRYACKRQLSSFQRGCYRTSHQSHLSVLHHHQQRHFVQAIKQVFNKQSKELNDLEEQAYGCTENAQFTRALWGFEQLMSKDPDCARYYFDYGLTIIKYIEDPPADMISDAHTHFQKAVQLAPTEPRIIKTYGSLLMDTAFNDKQKCIEEARDLFDGYFQRVIGDYHRELHELSEAEYKRIDTDVLFLYAQLLDEQQRDYVLAKQMFETCISIASRQQLHYEKIDEYRLRYGFYLYKQQDFELAVEQFGTILENFRLQIDAYNKDPNEGLEKKDQVHFNNYLRRRRPNTLSHIFANLYLGLIHSDLGDYNKAVKYFERMMSYKDKFYVKDDHQIQIIMLNEYILHLIRIGDFKQAHECWMEAFRLDKLLSVNKHQRMHYLGTTNFDVLTIGGHLFSEKGFKKKADRYFKNLMKMVDTISDDKLQRFGLFNPYYFYGLHCLRMEKFEAAKQSFMKLCKMHPYFPEFYYQLSVSCAKLKEYDEASKYLNQAMNLNFKMIYPKYFTYSDNIFKRVAIDIPEDKRALLTK